MLNLCHTCGFRHNFWFRELVQNLILDTYLSIILKIAIEAARDVRMLGRLVTREDDGYIQGVFEIKLESFRINPNFH